MSSIPDVSKVNYNGVLYNVKDAVTRGKMDEVDAARQQAIQDIQAEGQTQTGAVTAEGTAQKNAVTAEGTRVLGTIPSDYTALAGDVSDLKSVLGYEQIILTAGGYIVTNGSSTNFAVVSNESYYYTIENCEPFDLFDISATGTNIARLWAFTDNDGNILKKVDGSKDARTNHEYVYAPLGATKLIVNSNNGSFDVKRIFTLNAFKPAITDISTDTARLLSDVASLYNELGYEVIELTQGGYIVTNGDQTDFQVHNDSGYYNKIISCSPYDLFVISGVGTGAARLWAFTDDYGNILSKPSGAVDARSNYEYVYAPLKSTKLIVNSSTSAYHVQRLFTLNAFKKAMNSMANECDGVSEIIQYNKIHGRSVTNETVVWEDGQMYNNSGAKQAYENRSASPQMPCVGMRLISIQGSSGNINFYKADGVTLSKRYTRSANLLVFYPVPEDAMTYAITIVTSSKSNAVIKTYADTYSLKKTVCYAPAQMVCGRDAFIDGWYVNTTEGYISTGNDSWCSAPYISVKPNHAYRTNRQMRAVFYNADGEMLTGTITGMVNGQSIMGCDVEMDFTTPENCAFVTLTSSNVDVCQLYDIDQYEIIGKTENPLKLLGKTIVCFGDSITGNYGYGDNYVSRIEEITGAKTINVGFGACRMELLENPPSGNYSNTFSMCSLVDEIVKANTDNTKWSDQDTVAASELSTIPNWYLRLQKLKSIDFSEVDYISIAYGTNEEGYPQDDEQNPENKYTYAGATRYCIKTMLTKYPHLRFILMTPVYKYHSGSVAGGDLVDGDNYEHPSFGGTLAENVQTLIDVGHELKTPVVDLYYKLGINRYNFVSFFPSSGGTVTDGTHPNSYGRRIMGQYMAGEIEKYF